MASLSLHGLPSRQSIKVWLVLAVAVSMINIIGLTPIKAKTAFYAMSTKHHMIRGIGVGEEKTTPSKVCNPQNFLVLIKAGAKAKYRQRRKKWRDSTCPISYKKQNVKYRFMLGMPANEHIDPNGHNQAARASDEEIADMER